MSERLGEITTRVKHLEVGRKAIWWATHESPQPLFREWSGTQEVIRLKRAQLVLTRRWLDEFNKQFVPTGRAKRLI